MLKLAYFLNSCYRYNNLKSLVNEILNDETSNKKRYFDLVIISFLLISIYILVDKNRRDDPFFIHIELIAVSVFIFEWLARLWVCSDIHKTIVENHKKYHLLGRNFRVKKTVKEIFRDKLNFIISPMSIIDLLAILPSFRSARILRIFLLFRLFKIFRYTSSIKRFLGIFVEKRFEFGTLAFLFSFIIFFSAIAIYIYEEHLNDKINSIFDAVYWSIITITTVGYGDIVPHSIEGKVITSMLVFAGMTLVVLATSITTSALTAKMKIIKEENTKSKTNRLKNYTIICGFGEMGAVLAKFLAEGGKDFFIIDEKSEEIRKAKEHNYLAIKGDGTDLELFQNLNTKNLKSVAIITENDAINLSILLTIKSLNKNIKTIIRANNKNSKSKFKIAGASKVIFPYELAAFMAVEYIGQPIMAFDVIDKILITKGGASIDEVLISHPKTLRQTKYHNFRLKIIGVIRGNINNFMFHPNDNFKLENKDKLIVFGNSDLIASFQLKCMKKK